MSVTDYETPVRCAECGERIPEADAAAGVYATRVAEFGDVVLHQACADEWDDDAVCFDLPEVPHLVCVRCGVTEIEAQAEPECECVSYEDVGPVFAREPISHPGHLFAERGS